MVHHRDSSLSMCYLIIRHCRGHSILRSMCASLVATLWGCVVQFARKVVGPSCGVVLQLLQVDVCRASISIKQAEGFLPARVFPVSAALMLCGGAAKQF